MIPQPFSQAVLTFRGAANGDEAPIRVIQGPLTGIFHYMDNAAIDPVNNEIYISTGPNQPRDRILVFPREANGNVAPIRVLHSPDAFRGVSSVAIDPIRNLLLVSGETPDRQKAVMIFDRTAQGNAKPLRVVLGPSGRMLVSPEKGVFLVVVKPPRPRGGVEEERGRQTAGLSASASDKDYVGVWSVDDSGAVPPGWMIGGPSGVLQWIFGVTLNPKEKTVVVTDMRLNAAVTYSFPEIFGN